MTDLSGQRFERLTVVRLHEIRRRVAVWLTRCDCGNDKLASSSNLRAGHTKSCGCLRRELGRNRGKTFNRKHGQAGKTKTYATWQAMISRCTNPANAHFKYYGAKNVRVFGPWFSFERFVADMGERPPGKTIDRIDPFGNYEPGNCRWATPLEQARNKRGHK